MSRITPGDIDRLRSVLDAMETAYEGSAKSGGLALDLEFHREIFLLAGNNRMLRAHDDLAAQMLLAATRNKALREGVYPPAVLHRDVLDALEAHSEKRLAAAVQAHYAWMGDRLFGADGVDTETEDGAHEGETRRGRRREAAAPAG